MNEQPKSGYRYRRLLQFRLRTLLALIVLSSLLMAWWHRYLESYREQQQAVAAISKYARHIAYAPGQPAWMRYFADEDVFRDVVHLSFQSQRRFTNSDMFHLAKMPRLVRVSFQHTSITDDGVQHLSKLHQLDTISFESTAITDNGLKYLRALPKLRMLQLNRTRVTGTGLQHLATLTSLERLEIADARTTSADVRALSQLTNLKTLELNGEGFLKPDWPVLSALRQLETLTVHNPSNGYVISGLLLEHLPRLSHLNVSSSGLDEFHLRDLPRLSTLAVSGSLSDEATLEDLPRLTELNLSNRSISTKALQAITALPNLQTLNLSHARILSPGWQHLGDLRAIRQLELLGTGISGDRLRYLSRLKTLRTLSLARNPIQGKDLIHLRDLSKLKALDLSETSCFRSDLAEMPRGNLRRSPLFSPIFSPATGTDHLLALRDLEHISLAYTGARIGDILPLRDLPRLKFLQVFEPGYAFEQKDLEKLFPTTNISILDSQSQRWRWSWWSAMPRQKTIYRSATTDVPTSEELIMQDRLPMWPNSQPARWERPIRINVADGEEVDEEL